MENWLSYQVLMRYKTILWIIFLANLTLSFQDIYWMVVTGRVRHPKLTPWHPHKYPFQIQFHNSLSLFIPNHFIVILRFPPWLFCELYSFLCSQTNISRQRIGTRAWPYCMLFCFNCHKYFSLYLGEMKSKPLAPSPLKHRWMLDMNFLRMFLRLYTQRAESLLGLLVMSPSLASGAENTANMTSSWAVTPRSAARSEPGLPT